MNRRRRVYSVALTALVAGWAVTTAMAQTVFHVDDDAPPYGDGATWATAFQCLQDALYVVLDGDEIRVAGGVYLPDRDETGLVTAGDQGATFELVGGVTVAGGYAGLANPDNPDQRDLTAFETVLSGDLAGNDGPDLANNDENCRHVATADQIVEDFTLDGLTIRGGNSTDGGGGGLFLYGISATCTLNYCTFTDNTGFLGGALRSLWSTGPVLTHCTFQDNVAGGGGGLRLCEGSATLEHCVFRRNRATVGGGLVMCGGASVITDCMFEANTATGTGGGVYMGQSYPQFNNCAFIENRALIDGGAVYTEDYDAPQFANCLFAGNSAVERGGAIRFNWSMPRLANCTFAANHAPTGRAIAFGDEDYYMPSVAEITESILWNGGDEIANEYESTVTITNSDVQGGWPGEGNFDEDPLFVAGPLGWLYLSQTAAGQSQQSPCADAGSGTAVEHELDDLTTRQDEIPDDGIVDLGYHYPLGGGMLLPGDFDYDGDLDLADWARFEACFSGTCDEPPCLPRLYTDPRCNVGDYDDDGDIDPADFDAFRSDLTGPS